MKIADGFLLRKIMGRQMIVPTGSRSLSSDGMFTLTESSALLWEELKRGGDETALVAKLLETYDVDERTAKADVSAFLKKLRQLKILVD